MVILVTGASSFIGSHIATHLARRGHEVVGTFLHESARVERLHEDGGVRLVELDIADPGGFDALPRDVDAIVHAAALSVVTPETIDAVIACNVTGTLNVLRYAARAEVGRMVFLSSLLLHGEVWEPVVDETTPSRAPGIYGATKLLCETMMREWSTRFPVLALRPPGVIGPGAHRAWLPTVFNAVKAGKPLDVYNPDAAYNNAVHVRDLAVFIEKLLAPPVDGFHAFPLGASGSITVREAVEILMDVTGVQVPVNIVEAPRSRFTVSSAYAIEKFGYEPMNIADMLRDYAGEA